MIIVLPLLFIAAIFIMDWTLLTLSAVTMGALTYLLLQYNKKIINPAAAEDRQAQLDEPIDIRHFCHLKNLAVDPQLGPESIKAQLWEAAFQHAYLENAKPQQQLEQDGPIYIGDDRLYDSINHHY